MKQEPTEQPEEKKPEKSFGLAKKLSLKVGLLSSPRQGRWTGSAIEISKRQVPYLRPGGKINVNV